VKHPRDYQIEAVNRTLDFLSLRSGNPLIGLPTGTGKALVIAGLIYRVMQHNPYRRVVMLTHVRELVLQNYEELLEVWPQAPVGLHSDGLKRRDCAEPIIFGSVQSYVSTIKKVPTAFGHRDLLIVDEAHLIPPSEEGLYQQAIASMPGVRIVGMTATPFRMKHGLLTEGGVFEDFSFNMTGRDEFNWFIRQGYLAPLVPKGTRTKIDLSSVRVTAGEFNSKDLQEASNKELITIGAVKEMLELAGDRAKWLIFASGIAHVESVVEILDKFGVSSVFSHSKVSKSENDAAVSAFKTDPSIRAMVNADRLTTGFNAPMIDMIAFLRATMSSSLHVQMLGRGTRPFPGKRDCLVLDFAGNVPRLGPINDPVLPRKPGERGAAQPAPAKYCDACGFLNHASARLCVACEAEFQMKVKFKTQAGEADIVSGLNQEELEETWEVSNVFYAKHVGKTNIPSLRVTYSGRNGTASEFVFFEHKGFMRTKAMSWWFHRSQEAPPASVDECLARSASLPNPKTIRILKSSTSKYPQVTHVQF